jgi:hypothetical protein
VQAVLFLFLQKNNRMNKYQDPMEGTSYDGKEVRLCKDGKYRWKYEVNMFKNPAILITVFKVFFYTIVGLFLVFGFFLYVIHGDWEGLWGMTKGMFVALGIFAVLSVLGYLIVAWMYGGKYIVLFELDEKVLKHTQLPAQFERARKLGVATAFVGLLARKPSVAGAGLISASRNSSTSVLANVRRVKPRRWLHLIKVNQLLNHNQVYVTKEDFDFVYGFIQSHCPNAK